MPTRKIAEPNKKDKCNHFDHNPASHMVYKEGTYEHTCPACGHKQTFVVNRPTL